MMQRSAPGPMPIDAAMRAKALARWEGEGGALGPPRAAADALDGARAKAAIAAFPRENMDR